VATIRKALVFIVESPKSEDLVTGKLEGRLLSESLRLDGISQQYYLVTDVEIFRTMVEYFKRIMTAQRNVIPILHISAHGSEDGIAFTNGRMMKWSTLVKILVNLNQACNGKLVLSLSCCMGSYINLELIKSIEQMPFQAAISAVGSPTWNDAAVAFVVFYHQYINKRIRISDAASIMNDASASETWFMLYHARITQKSLVNYFQKEFKKNSKVLLHSIKRRSNTNAEI
jgi:Peptidase C13 family